jgi:hypothetical protein
MIHRSGGVERSQFGTIVIRRQAILQPFAVCVFQQILGRSPGIDDLTRINHVGYRSVANS